MTRRLDLWHSGELKSLVDEGNCIQKRLPHGGQKSDDNNSIAKSFKNMMVKGNVHCVCGAMRLLAENANHGVHKLNDVINEKNAQGEEVNITVREILRAKHPKGCVPPSTSMLVGCPTAINPIVFASLDADSIRHAALRTKGAAGISGLDAHAWRRLCSSFKSASNDLCAGLAAVGRRIATESVHPDGLSAFVTCRLVPLNKCPGVRPIGIGEVPRRIISS